MADLKDVTVYILRGNPFHNGHAYVLKRALETSKFVVVLIGSSGQARTIKNPFTFDERKQMIESWMMNLPVAAEAVILPIYDHSSNSMWIKQVQKVIKDAVLKQAITSNDLLLNIYLTGSDRDATTWYLNSFPQWGKVLCPPQDSLSATSVREVLYNPIATQFDYASLSTKVPQTTRAFLERFRTSKELVLLQQEHAFIKAYKQGWSVAPHPPIFVTADAVVIQSGHVLVVEREALPGKGLWALPGGFVNQHERIRTAAVRELIEETGIRLSTGKQAAEVTEKMLRGSIRAEKVFDAPYRSARGRTITTAYLFRLDDTKPLPSVKGQNVPAYEANGKDIVETANAFWLPLEKALETTNMWFEDHHAIVEHFVNIEL